MIESRLRTSIAIGHYERLCNSNSIVIPLHGRERQFRRFLRRLFSVTGFTGLIAWKPFLNGRVPFKKEKPDADCPHQGDKEPRNTLAMDQCMLIAVRIGTGYMI
jgi:hypothetical protein